LRDKKHLHLKEKLLEQSLLEMPLQSQSRLLWRLKWFLKEPWLDLKFLWRNR
jgi:hypothetical protein